MTKEKQLTRFFCPEQATSSLKMAWFLFASASLANFLPLKAFHSRQGQANHSSQNRKKQPLLDDRKKR
ncbi:hypothetical protein [uncultured Cohaesibacter sp.]|uniref:hypothetical protein n=1 Tax=uncultured Cohaesibacter sp. TaxID=1002546 RepID=UPI002AA771AC|nr:hypothetical protein [uncultured Cohaesibacter sp.]